MAWDRLTIKFDGRSYEFPISEVDVNPDNPRDEEIRVAASAAIFAQHQEENPGVEPVRPDFSRFVVDPPEAERLRGDHADKTVLNLRPSASYGSNPTTDG